MLFKHASNSKKQGDIGLAVAISKLSQMGFTVSLPLTDSQDYDLIFDDSKLNKVQVKTTSFKRGARWNFNLSVKGGNKSTNTIKKFDNTKVDYLIVVTSEGEVFLIPSSEILSTGTMSLLPRHDIFKI